MSEQMQPVLLSEWLVSSPVPDQMYWKGPAAGQAKELTKLAEAIGMAPMVVSTHRSKSIVLPVVRFDFVGGSFYIRHNFHDINLVVTMEAPPQLFLPDLYGEGHNLDWYNEQIAKVRDYSYQGWTDEEMSDPHILRVLIAPRDVDLAEEPERGYWSKVSPEAKDRWVERGKSTAWYRHDWASGSLIVQGDRIAAGPPNSVGDLAFGPDCLFFPARYCFAEGIDDALPQEIRWNSEDSWQSPWEPGKKNFALSCGHWDEVLRLMQLILAAKWGTSEA